MDCVEGHTLSLKGDDVTISRHMTTKESTKH